MPADTAAKRYSAMNLSCPWRGLNVVPNVAIPQGERQAVMYYYSGILWSGGGGGGHKYRVVGKGIFRIPGT
jgi:hypothetical protein